MPIFVSVSVIRGNSIDACFSPLFSGISSFAFVPKDTRASVFFFTPVEGILIIPFFRIIGEFELSRIRVCVCVIFYNRRRNLRNTWPFF